MCGFLILGLQQHLLAETVQQCVQNLQVNICVPPELSLMPEKCRYALSSALLCKPQTASSANSFHWAAAHPIVPRAGSNPGQGKSGLWHNA